MSFPGRTIQAIAGAILLLAGTGGARAAIEAASVSPTADLATACQSREGWTDPAPPERIFGNTWYVGTCGISVLLITSDAGHVLIDGGPAEVAPLVIANIEKLGFRPADVAWIVSSHEHHDHVGALAELKRLTGGRVAALRTAASALAGGTLAADDPQRSLAPDYPPVVVDRILVDGHDLRVGPLLLTVHATPAHSPGSASWTWSSCEQVKCRTIAYADSATLISADGYRFTDHPERLAAAREGLARMAELPCEVLVTPHPGASNLFARVAGRVPLSDAEACRRYAEAGEQRLAERLAREQQADAAQ